MRVVLQLLLLVAEGREGAAGTEGMGPPGNLLRSVLEGGERCGVQRGDRLGARCGLTVVGRAVRARVLHAESFACRKALKK